MRLSDLLRSSEYETAYDFLLRRAVDSIVREDPVIGQMPVRLIRHSGKLRYVYAEVWDIEPNNFSITFSLRAAEAREPSFGAFELVVRCIAEHSIVSRRRSRTETLMEGLKKSGRLLPGNPPLSWEAILAALEMTELSFDENGDALLPRVECGAEAYRNFTLQMKPLDFQDRLEELIYRKQREWDAKKRTRRLPR